MVTLVVFAVVATTITLVLMTSAKSKQRTSQHIESAQAARAALDLMARDIRSAGYGTDLDWTTPQQAIAYVDASEIILAENLSPYPDAANGHTAPLAYNPNDAQRPHPLDGTSWAPPIRYRTGAELVRYTLDVNNDGVVDANDVASPEGADAAATPNPTDYVLVRQVYGDSTGNVANNNGPTTQRVALVRKPATAGVPPLFSVYMKGSSTPWDWSNGPVPQNQLQNIQRVSLQVTATSSRPDARGAYAQTTLTSQVNAGRSVPDFGATVYSTSGYVYNDVNTNHVKDGADVGLPGAVVRMGSLIAYTNSSGFYQIMAPAGSYTLKHTPPMGYGSFTMPDTFNVLVTNVALTRSFGDTARSGGNVSILAYNDLNGNGVQDVGEGPMSGVQFTITPGSPGATTAITNGAGIATLFTATGGFSVQCNAPDSFTVAPANPQTGTIVNHGTASVAFGLFKQLTGTVAGEVFADADRNGVISGSNEKGVPNVWVGVSGDGGATIAGYAYTDQNGLYSIAVPINDPPHTTPYTVIMTPPPGYFPTLGTALGSVWVQANVTTGNKNFGLATFQIISLNASRVLSLTSTDLIENDWGGGHADKAHHDTDLILGADAGGTDNVSVWFNQWSNSPLFASAPSGSGGYTRMAPNSVLSMVVDTLDQNDIKARPDLVTGTKFTANGNFFVWFTQGTNSNEGFFSTSYSPGQNYKTQDNGDVQAVATLDCGGGSMPDIIVGTKGATAGQGSVEVWLSNDAVTPTFTRDEIYNMVGSSLMGEVTGMALADLDQDGDKDLVVVTRKSDFTGQIAVFENVGRTTGNRFVLRYSDTFASDSPTAVACLDADGDGWTDIVVGTQNSSSQGRLYQYRNLGAAMRFTFGNIRRVDAPGIVMSLNAADYGGPSRIDLAVGYRTSTTGFGGGLVLYYMDLGLIPSTGTDPSAGVLVNMVPALTSANFNYGLNTSATAPTPYLTDLAAGVKASATAGALVIFIR
jgi:Tfp pilus assembly protein PilW